VPWPRPHHLDPRAKPLCTPAVESVDTTSVSPLFRLRVPVDCQCCPCRAVLSLPMHSSTASLQSRSFSARSHFTILQYTYSFFFQDLVLQTTYISSFPGALSASAIPEVAKCGLVQRISPPMCSPRYGHITMFRGESDPQINLQTITEMPTDNF
jgi:hypothetical protein